MNDCFDIMKQNISSKILMYADDTILLSYGDNVNDAVQLNQSQFDIYIKWTNKNGLKINAMKTQHMLFCSKSANKNVDPNYHVQKGDRVISNTLTYKYLGCTLDQNLTLEAFVKDIVQRVNFKLYLFSKIRHQLTFEAAVLVYKQMVLPFFDYLDILIDCCVKKYIEKLQRLQFRGIKIIYQYKIEGKQITNKDEMKLHHNLKLSYLEERRKRHLLNMMYSLVAQRKDLIVVNNTERSLRSDRNIHFEEDLIKSEIYGKSPYIRGNHLWKQLDYNIQRANSKIEFHTLLTDDVIVSLKS